MENPSIKPVRGPVYSVHSPRLLIRCWNPEDAPKLAEALYASRDHLYPWMAWAPRTEVDLEATIQDLRRFRGNFDLGQEYVYGIFTPDGQRVVGGTGLHLRLGKNVREIGYWIRAEETHKGYAREVAETLTRVAFEIDGVERVEIHVAVENERSNAIPRRLGYTLEGTLRKRILFADGRCVDMMVWTMLASEFASSPCAKAALEAYDAIGRRIL